MRNILLIDFGASRIKAAVWSIGENKIVNSLECDSPKPKFGAAGEVEVNPEDYWDCLKLTAGKLLDQYSDIRDMWICSEMHGILLFDLMSHTPLTPYISWQDERANRGDSYCPSTFSKFDDAFRLNFLRETGLKFRPGLPILTLTHLKNNFIFDENFRVCTLVDWLLYRGGENSPKVHSSLAAGTGFLSLDSGVFPNKFCAQLIPGLMPNHFSRLSNRGESIGTIRIDNHEINVFGGIGDLQAAAYGAGFPDKTPLLVNLGTGSQVLGAFIAAEDVVERRVGANQGLFAALTHIPSGRALNVFASFIDRCSIMGGGKPIFWEIFESLETHEIHDSIMNVDLNVFDASWKFQEGGSILGITEATFSPRIFIAALAKSWLKQYVDAIDLIDPNKMLNSFVLAGGLSKRGKFVLPVLEDLSKRSGSFAQSATGEETLDGLLALASNHYAA